MTFEGKVSQVFRLSGDNWMRHANPWSVRTRYTVLPLIVLAFWSRLWLGWWSVVPVVLSLAWMFINPVIFRKPASTKSWESRSVLGERAWMNRDGVKIPEHHRRFPHVLNAISSIGMLLVIWAVIVLDIWPAVLGISLAYVGKSWYLDRMVWLLEDMKHRPEYRKWIY
jgi:hypothetical protein